MPTFPPIVIVNEMQTRFKKSWFGFLFWWTDLGQLLNQHRTPSDWDFFQTYLNSSWLSRVWFRSCIQTPEYLTEFDYIVNLLESLKNTDFSAEANFNATPTHVAPSYVTQLLYYLYKYGISTPDSFAAVVAHPNPGALAGAFFSLRREGILTPDNFTIVATHANSVHLAIALNSLQMAGILTQDIFTMVATDANSLELAWLFFDLHRAGILSQDNLTALLAVKQAYLITADARKLIWSRIPTHLLTKENFQRLLTAAEHHNSTVELERVRDQILDVRGTLGAGHATTFNQTQSTHEDAKSLFVEGLYEIEIGANFDDTKNDKGCDDKPIFTSKVFNKPMKKLNGIHQDVASHFITHEGACSKFPKLADTYAKAYLQSIASPATTEDYRKVKELLEHLKTDGSLEPIWNNIITSVQKDLWDEFKSAYNNNENHPQFVGLIDNVACLAPPDLSGIEYDLLASRGYQAYMDEQVCFALSEQHSLWASRHSSIEAQKKFDQVYGLVIKS